MTTTVEQRVHALTATADSYQAVSDLKKIINDEIKKAVSEIEEKYAEQLKELTDNHEFYVSLLTP